MEERTRGPRRDTRTRKPMTPQERRNLLYKRWRKAEQQKVDAKELRDPTTCDMVVFDLELAGYAEDDIIEIAAIKVDFLGRQTAVFRELIRPRTKISKRVTEMTGITRDMVKDKPQLPEVLKRFFCLCGRQCRHGARYRLQRYHGHQPCLSPLRHEGLPPAFFRYVAPHPAPPLP